MTSRPATGGAWFSACARRAALLLAVVLCLLPGRNVRAAARPTDAPVARGLAVLALGGATDAARALARAVYADSSLRPPTLDEPHARVLAGEDPQPGAPTELRELAESRAAVHGDDAASRRLLASIASSLEVIGLVVVDASHAPSARVFLASSGAYSADVYPSDPPPLVTWGNAPPAVTWWRAVAALRKAYGLEPAPPAPSAPPPVAAPAEVPPASRPFYKSPWFWAAAGAAVFAAIAIYVATRGDSGDNVQVQVQVPR